MSSPLVHAFMYMVFALSLLILTFWQGVHVSSEVYQAVVSRFLTSPWKLHPARYIYDVKGGPQVYEWLDQVFVPQLYLDQPEMGQGQGYCSVGSPCLLAEGNADSPEECSGSLQPGDRNCATSLGPAASCCEPCSGPQCPSIQINTEVGKKSANTSVTDLSASCADEMPAWLSQLSQWTSDDRPSTVPDPEISFCPERLSKVDVDISLKEEGMNQQLNVGLYNRALMGRITLKRRKLHPFDSKSFANPYQRILKQQKVYADRYDPENEDTDSFGQFKRYTYEENAGYKSAGGFVEHLNFDQPRSVIQKQLSALNRDSWFNLKQGSLTVEMLLFNGNVDKLIYVSFVIEHDHSGQAEVSVSANCLKLSVHDLDKWESWARFMLYIIILVCFTVFLKNEIEDMSADVTSYFTHVMGIIHVVSFGLCAYCILTYAMIVCSFTFLNFSLPISPIASERNLEFQNLASLADMQATFMVWVSTNTGLICVQAIALMSNLAPHWSLILITISRMRKHLLAFLAILVVLILGFVQAGMLLFGESFLHFSDFLRGIVSGVQMVNGQGNYTSLQEAHPGAGYMYFLIFHICFLIFKTVLLSIIINGYIFERRSLENADSADTYPLRRFVRSTKAWLNQYSAFIRRCAASFQALFFGGRSRMGAQAARVNFENVAKLQDKRATKPRKRNVIYEQKAEDDDPAAEAPQGGEVKHQGGMIAADVKLRVVPPFFPDGMMHFYVESVANDGPAMDFKVQKDFRLISIQAEGATDRERFRNPKGFSEDPQKILIDLRRPAEDPQKKLPVRLEFEGKARLCSYECVLVLLLCIVFLLFSLNVSRVYDSYSSAESHREFHYGPTWYSHNPTRALDVNSVHTLKATRDWFKAGILDNEVACVLPLAGGMCGGEHPGEDNVAGKFREGWAFWAGANTSEELGLSFGQGNSELRFLRPGERPKAAEGMSLGAVPNQKRTGTVSGLSAVTTTVNIGPSNRGFMPNNHVRLTMQLPCFRKNPQERFSKGYPWVMDPALLSMDCANEKCMQKMMNSKRECYDRHGQLRDHRLALGKLSKLRYEFSQAGTFGELGGIAIGMGSTRREAMLLYDLVEKDSLLPISMVFEFVTYSSDYDLFTYTTAKFWLRDSGLLQREIHSVVFPLNIFSMGAEPDRQQKTAMNWAFFACYVLISVLFTIHVLGDFLLQLSITTANNRPWYMFPRDYLQDDIWNALDIVCVVMNILVIESIVSFMLIDGTFSLKEGFRSWTQDYEFKTEVGLDDADPFQYFSTAATLYEKFTNLAAINGLMVMIRFTKFCRSLASLRLVLTTLAAAIHELFTIIAIIAMVMVAFVFMMHTRFGIPFARYGTLQLTAQEIFLFLVGQFDTDDLYQAYPIYFTVVFILYEAVFFLILSIFLAAIIFRWQDTRRDAEDFSIAGAFRTVRDSVQISKYFQKQAHGQDQDQVLVTLDAEFWQKKSILSHLASLEDTGRIRITQAADGEGQRGRRLRNSSGGEGDPEGDLEGDLEAAEGEDPEEGDADGGGRDGDRAGDDAATWRPFNFERAEDRKRFIQVFKKAHMELASQLSRKVDSRSTAQPDGEEEPVLLKTSPGGMNLVEDEETRVSAMLRDEDAKLEMVGIIERPQSEQTVEFIESNLNGQLETSKPADEIWLDAVLTVLEEVDSLRKLQMFFLPMPMIFPKKAQDWGAFNQKKMKMERRLNMFLRWMQEEARVQHYKFLKEMAVSKERVLKQQSLVLADYLQTLDHQIEKLQDEMKILERKNASMRSHVSPLL
ncbi:unnamed protein product [Polarella glacialis]|uniref:Polycystin cation channel PKD1/PKD2 domain-containing protein n=1 Tax=Polarella glacialis TaxID=89957 RepID=A0A813G3G3_POLGL|nr:unnamed protein product [Polarella glacialis]